MMMMMMATLSQCQLQLQQPTTIISDRSKRQSSSPQSPIKLQRFLVEPENLTVNIGESIILPCRVSNKAGTVQCKLIEFSIIWQESEFLDQYYP